MIKKKRGVVVKGLKAPMIKPLQLVSDLFLLVGVTPVLTDGVADRKGKSLHPEGFAFDFRTRDLTHTQKSVIFAILVKQLGCDYDVIMYDTHIHVEFQKALDDRKEINFMQSFLVSDFEEVR
jgi:hypothetical protein